MSRILSLCIILSILNTVNPSIALTLTTSENYYLVVPTGANNIKRDIYDASPMISSHNNKNNKLKSIGLHQAQYGYNYWMKYNKKICYIDRAVVTLDSKIYLPKIDMDARQYTDTILTRFNTEAHETTVHEKEHRRIYINQLQGLVNKLRAITKENTTFANCDDLKKYVKTEYNRTARIIEQQNLNFDCFEYGKEFQLDFCDNATIVGKKVENSEFSSITQGNQSEVKSYKDKEKPNEETCDGQLIEPFKGKFYCVPANSYSEF